MAVFEGVFDAAIAHGQAVSDRLLEAAQRRPEQYKYGWKTVRDLAQLAGSGATLFLLNSHKKLAVPVSIATAAVSAGLTTMSAVFDPSDPPSEGTTEEDALREKITTGINENIPNIIGALTVALSSNYKETLTKPMDLTPRNPTVPFTTFERVRNASTLFAVYTIVGHWLEMAFCQLIRLELMGGDYDRSNTMLWDWWLHPFPAEGIAGLLIAGCLSPLSRVLLKKFGGRMLPAVAVSFLANQIVCTSIDYLTGIVANRNYELWDYRNMPFNFQGQICLQNSLVYSTAATLVTWLAYPAREAWLRRMPPELINLAHSAFAPVYAFLFLTYFA